MKNVHHHHKPLVIKEEKIIREIKKPIKIIEDISHDHFHHHYKHNHPEISDFDGGHQHTHSHTIQHHPHPKKIVLGDGGEGNNFSGFDTSGLRVGGSSDGAGGFGGVSGGVGSIGSDY